MGVWLRSFVALAIAAAVVRPYSVEAQDRTKLVIGTGAPGGVYHPLGSAICRLINLDAGANGLRCLAETSRGSVANINALKRRKVDFAVVQADVEQAAAVGADAFAGTGPARDLRAVLALHLEAFTVVARDGSGIARFEDLRGKRVSIGDVGSGQRMTAGRLLQAFGWTKKDFSEAAELGPVEQNEELCAGRLDAIFYFVGHPNGLIQDATARCHGHLVAVEGPAIDAILKAQPYLRPVVVPRGLYEGGDADTPTFGARAVLLTRADVPEAEVAALVDAVIGHFDVFRLLLPVLADLTPTELVPAAPLVPLHPGADSAFRKAGLLNN
jgi:TRAP transporter TAXI family solute receptor